MQPTASVQENSTRPLTGSWSKGYFRIPRTDIVDNPYWENPKLFRAFVYLRSLARSLPTADLKQGEFRISKRNFAKEMGLDRWLTYGFFKDMKTRKYLRVVEPARGRVATKYLFADMEAALKPAPVLDSMETAGNKTAKTSNTSFKTSQHEYVEPAPAQGFNATSRKTQSAFATPPLGSPYMEEKLFNTGDPIPKDFSNPVNYSLDKGKRERAVTPEVCDGVMAGVSMKLRESDEGRTVLASCKLELVDLTRSELVFVSHGGLTEESRQEVQQILWNAAEKAGLSGRSHRRGRAVRLVVVPLTAAERNAQMAELFPTIPRRRDRKGFFHRVDAL